MSTEYKFVAFTEYCKKCKHEKTKEFKDPCNECLETPVREGAEVPTHFKEKEKRIKK